LITLIDVDPLKLELAVARIGGIRDTQRPRAADRDAAAHS
jgi:hypothetical protein